MHFKSRQLAAALAVVLVSALTSSLSQATSVVNTGTPSGLVDSVFGTSQYFAGEFTLDGSFSLNSIQGYFSTVTGTVDISIHGDGGDIPGSILYTASFATGDGAATWRGVSGLDWSLDAGDYWVSFKPSFDSPYVSMPGGVATPMTQYAQGKNNYEWAIESPHFFDQVSIGVRIDATALAPVPEPASVLMYVLGLSGMALLARRKRG